jgi:hypothetical protein
MVSERPDIQDWLLRDGFRNEIMDEYLAYTCAVHGRLEDALKRENLDDPFLDSAVSLTSSLMMGGPAEGMPDYEPGPRVVATILGLLTSRAETVRRGRWVAQLQRFLSDAAGPSGARWGAELKACLLEQCAAYLARPELHAAVQTDAAGAGRDMFCAALALSEHVGIDLWEPLFERLKTGPLDSYFIQELASRSDAARGARVVAWAEGALDLDSVAVGPDPEHDLRHGEPEGSLSMLVQWMSTREWSSGRLPVSLKLVSAALEARRVSTRNTALQTLKGSPRTQWWPALRLLLKKCRKREPDKDVTKRFDKLIKGDLRGWS